NADKREILLFFKDQVHATAHTGNPGAAMLEFHVAVVAEGMQPAQLTHQVGQTSLGGCAQAVPGQPMAQDQRLACMAQPTPGSQRKTEPVRRGIETAPVLEYQSLDQPSQFPALAGVTGQYTLPAAPAFVQN